MGIPGDRFPEVTSFWDRLMPDKLIHLFLFSVWAYLMLRQNSMHYHGHPRRFLTFVAFTGIALSAITETLQHFVFINRSGNFFDGLVNVAGIIFGMLLYVALHRKKSDKP